MSSIQLTDFHAYNTEDMVFSKPEVGNIMGQKISFKRIKIGTRYPNGQVGDLILATPPQLLSFGLQESRDMATNNINGYSMPLCLWSRNGPTDEEKGFTDTFNAISDYCKKYLLEHREEIEKYDLDIADLKKFNPLFWKMEKGKIVEGRGPMLYAKVIHNKKTNQISTIFVNEDTNEETDPYEMMNKQCHVTAAIKIESIFIGNKISLQVKLFEVVYKFKDTTIRGLLRPDAIKKTTTILQEEIEEELEEEEVEESGNGIGQDEDEASEAGSLTLDEENTQEVLPTTPPPPPPLETAPVVEKPKRGGRKTTTKKGE